MWNDMGYAGWGGGLWPMAMHGVMGLLWIALLVVGIVVVVRVFNAGSRRDRDGLAVLEGR